MSDHHDPAISELYRRSRRPEPAAATDNAILDRARREVRRRRNRWLLPLSTAALVVMGLTLTLRMVDQQPPGFDEAELIDVPLMEVEPDSRLRKESAPLRQAPAASSPATRAAPRPNAVLELKAKRDTGPALDRVMARPTEERRQDAPAATTAPPPERELLGGAKYPSAPTASSSAEEPIDAAAQRTPAASGSIIEPHKLEGAAVDRYESAGVRPHPEVWLARIEAILAAGDERTARAELAAFRIAYPAYPVSDVMEPLLPLEWSDKP